MGGFATCPYEYMPLYTPTPKTILVYSPHRNLLVLVSQVCGPLVSASAGGFFYSIALDFQDAFIYV